MKKSLYLLSVLTIVFFTVELQAQTRFGLKAGINFSNINYKSKFGSGSFSGLTSFQFGGIAHIVINENFFFQPELLLNNKGFKSDVVGGTTKAKLAYLEAPLNLGLSLKIDKNVNFYTMAGLYFAVAIGGTYENAGKTADIEWGKKGDFKPFDMGLNVGTGLKINNLILGLQYGIGLSNIAPDNNAETSFRNKIFGISIAYLLGEDDDEF